MQLKSSAFAHMLKIPNKYTCDGEDISPPLVIEGKPEGTVSLVLIVDDPDAPGRTWLHWVLWDIDPKVEVILEGVRPDGAVEGMTDFGRIGWGGPCPPSGIHHYHFRLYALDRELDLEEGSELSEVKKEMLGHILAECELIGLYERGNF